MAMRSACQAAVNQLTKRWWTSTTGCLSSHCQRWHSGSSRPETAQAEKMTDIGTRKIFTEEHDMFRRTVRRFFEDEVIPHHAQWEKDGHVSRELWLKAGECGILGVNCPQEFGGIGGDFLTSAIISEEQEYSFCTGPGFTLVNDVMLPYVYRYGTKEQIERYVPAIVSGKCIGSIAMTEPGAGSDLQGIKTYARRDGSDWILNGSKTFITNGYMCDVVIVVAVTDAEAKSRARGISLFLVDAGTPGFHKGRTLEKIGMKAQDAAELFFEDVRLPETAVLGKLNAGFYHLMSELPQERLILAAAAAAGCEAMFEETRSYVTQRKAFGKTLSALQTIQHKLAEMKTQTCIARVFVDQLMKQHSESGLDSERASMAKYWVTELQNIIATQCLQMHGGAGYMMEMPIARAFVDARVQPIYGGSNEIMKELIARSIVA